MPKRTRMSRNSCKGLRRVRLKAGEVPDRMFDQTQLKMGIEVEMEHTDCKAVAKQIAKAHLMEMPDYYTRLDRMERGLC